MKSVTGLQDFLGREYLGFKKTRASTWEALVEALIRYIIVSIRKSRCRILS
ncbi:MAG: hypothetical protein ACI9FB_001977 [Candidatus Azotimanducaceae bacterium]|jgi:hypothetical protein